MLPVFLVFVGASLFVNGIWMWRSTTLDSSVQLAGKDIAVVNLFTGFLGAVIIASTLAKSPDTASAAPAAYIGLFALTYLWVGANQFTGASGTALGWFSLVVTGIALPVGIHSLSIARGTFGHWIAISWFAWAGLWFLFFLTLGLGRPLIRATALVAVAEAIGTALVPAVLLFTGVIQA
ncbi:AmiS/UreI family transporter [Nocardia abscessus]|uniref:AmiS/UreI family transporter n=1 Tax=Nocardia abscessus TaxID=120957 RepID=UPI00031DF29B|nr:AmiS/UreI family transporter [Nocardia abscessus]MCC3332155.1 AmiS/UreI family transporter [Nocardia abscessus]